MIKLLRDKIFISTRPGGPSDQLTQLLTASGASVLELPLIKIEAASLSEVENNYLSRLATFQWIIFTSPNGVRYFFEILKRTNGNHQLPAHVQMAVIGHKTGKTVESFGHPVSFVNPGSTAEDFSETFAQHIKNSLEKPNILLPLGNLARSVIQDSLKKTARCFRMVVYKTEMPEKTDYDVIERIEKGDYDMVIFTSPSGIQNFLKIWPKSGGQTIRMACIGPTTANAAVKNGFQPLVVAQNSSATGIFESILNFYILKP